MERRVELEVSVSRHIHFSDTLPLLRKVLISVHLQLKKKATYNLGEEGWGKDPPRFIFRNLHRKVIGCDIEGRDYNNITEILYLIVFL